MDHDDLLRRQLAALTPHARQALEQALLRATGLPATPSPLGSELVNTDVEHVESLTETQLEAMVRRAAREGARAPLLKLGSEDDFALLVSARHVWNLIDRIDELQAALDVLAIVFSERPSGADDLAETLRELGIDIHRANR